MVIRVSPTEPAPTHDVALTARDGTRIGLKFASTNGKHSDFGFQRMPLERTALKTSSGSGGSYADYEYPYSPVVQDDFSGGLGGIDFERDTTKYMDGHRIRTGITNRAFLGPQEQMTYGYRHGNWHMPGNVIFVRSNTARAWSFYAHSDYTAARVGILARRVGKMYPTDNVSNDTPILTAELRGADGTLITTAAIHAATDDLSQWYFADIDASMTQGDLYTLYVYADGSGEDYWEIALDAETRSIPYAQITDADEQKTAHFIEYKGAMYAFVSSADGAPEVWLNGDRGVADFNFSNLYRLNDSTKNWPTDRHAGKIAMLMNGRGDWENPRYRTIASNGADYLEFDEPWIEEHDVNTEYVILGSDIWVSLGDCGLIAPVTSVLLVRDYLMVAQGERNNAYLRKLRAFTDAGDWKDMDDEDCQEEEEIVATHLAWAPKADKIYRSLNGGTIAVSAADAEDWGTAHTWDAHIPIGDAYWMIRALQVYVDSQAVETLYIFKEDIPYTLTVGGDSPMAFSLSEISAFKDKDNGLAALVHNIYLYFPLRVGMQRWYDGLLDDLSINNAGEGLPANRRGPIVASQGYPGKFFISTDAGPNGYSAIYDRDGSWSERYRAPLGQAITAMGYQVIPGQALDRLWFFQGNNIMWLPFPSDSTNELFDAQHLYTHEGNLYLSRMHSGMFDVQKICNAIKLWLERTEAGTAWINVFYRLDDATDWTMITQPFSETPTHKVTFSNLFGLVFKSIQLRLRFTTTDASVTPVLLASIVETVMRTEAKYIYKLTFILDDYDLQGNPEELTAERRLQILDDWADASSTSMLNMEAADYAYHGQGGRKVFLNPLQIDTISLEEQSPGGKRRTYLCNTTAQDA